MTCEDCIHYDICLGAFGVLGHVCDSFKDKSKFIELPCSVGNTVYVYFQGYIERDHVIGFEILNGKIQVITSICKFKLNEDAFLTKEEAEKKLEDY